MPILIRYHAAVRNAFLLSALLSILVFLGYVTLIHHQVASENMRQEAERMSRFSFEVLKSNMVKGWARADVNRTIILLNHIDPDIQVSVIRSPTVEQMYGKRVTHAGSETFPEVQAKLGKDLISFEEHNNGVAVYGYTLPFSTSCLACHSNAKVGELSAVIQVTIPESHMRLTLHNLFSTLGVSFLVTMSVTFVVLYVFIRRNFIRPVADLAERLSAIDSHADLTQPIALKTRIYEVKSIEDAFNSLAQRLQASFGSVKTQAEFDPLTKVYNRGKFIKVFAQEAQHVGLAGGDLAILYLDMDCFKEINDRFGHVVGDLALRQVATTLTQACRDQDMIFRVGGDEFLVLLLGSNASDAQGVQKRIEARMAKVEMESDGQRILLSLSIGYAALSEVDGEAEALIPLADQRMYASKIEKDGLRCKKRS